MSASPLSRPILIRGLADAQAAAQVAESAGAGLALMAPPAGGALWLLGVLERVRRSHPALGLTGLTGLLDCGDRAGEAQGALAAGIPALLFTGHPLAAARLAAVAAARGATLLTVCPPLLDLAAESRGGTRPERLEALCRAWLTRPDG